MALDPSIALQAKPAQFDNPLTQYAQVAAIQNAQNQNQLAQYTIGKAQREDADTQAVRNLLTGAGGDLEKGKNALYGGGFYKQAMEIGKAQLDQDKTKSEIGKNNATAGATEYETKMKKWKTAVNDIAAFDDAPSAIASLQAHVKAGDVPPERAEAIMQTMPQTGDKAAFRQWQLNMIQGIMEAKDRMGYLAPDANAQLASGTSLQVAAGHDRTALTTNANTVDATRRGQDMKAAEGQYDPATGMLIDTTSGKATQVVSQDGKPVSSGKPLTESQGKATGFAARAQEADKLIASLNGKYSPAAINSKSAVESTPLIGGALAAGVNKFTLSAQDRQAEQAQRDFINAVLRQESGAAIGNSEFDSARKQYFTQPGDDAATIAQKATNRRLAIEGLKSSAGPGAAKIDGMVTNSRNVDLNNLDPKQKEAFFKLAEKQFGLRHGPGPAAAGSASTAKPSLDDIFGK